jgi:hypothetical protein
MPNGLDILELDRELAYTRHVLSRYLRLALEHGGEVTWSEDIAAEVAGAIDELAELAIRAHKAEGRIAKLEASVEGLTNRVVANARWTRAALSDIERPPVGRGWGSA